MCILCFLSNYINFIVRYILQDDIILRYHIPLLRKSYSGLCDQNEFAHQQWVEHFKVCDGGKFEANIKFRKIVREGGDNGSFNNLQPSFFSKDWQADFLPHTSALHRSKPGKETGRAWHRPAFNVCTNHFNHATWSATNPFLAFCSMCNFCTKLIFKESSLLYTP